MGITFEQEPHLPKPTGAVEFDETPITYRQTADNTPTGEVDHEDMQSEWTVDAAGDQKPSGAVEQVDGETYRSAWAGPEGKVVQSAEKATSASKTRASTKKKG